MLPLVRKKSVNPFSLVLFFVTKRHDISNFLGKEKNPHLVYPLLILATIVLTGEEKMYVNATV